MNRQAAINILRSHADALRARGVQHAALFGSVARDNATPGSDLDVMVELDPHLRLDLFTYAELKTFIEALFPGPVDVVDRAALKPDLRNPVSADAVYAF